MSDQEYQNVDIEWLSALDPSDVDFARLPESALEQLALGTEPNFATLAISELRRRKSGLAAKTAQVLLAAKIADRYLKAAALSVLFDTDRARALKYMLAAARDADPLLINAMMEIMIRDEEAFSSGVGLSLVPLMKSRLRTMTDDEYPTEDARHLFAEIYGRD